MFDCTESCVFLSRDYLYTLPFAKKTYLHSETHNITRNTVLMSGTGHKIRLYQPSRQWRKIYILHPMGTKGGAKYFTIETYGHGDNRNITI